MKKLRFLLISILIFALLCTGCGASGQGSAESTASEASSEESTKVESEAAEEVPVEEGKENAEGETSEADSAETEAENAGEAESAEAAKSAVEKNGDVYILYTSDVHCGVDQGFGYEGLQQIRDTLEKQGYTTLLVDDGDAIQGEPIGTLSKGESIIEIMNALKYDVAIPGNHEFDYTVERFLELAEMADFPYISCNFNKEGDLILQPYIIKEAAGMRIAFVGVTTPQTPSSSRPAYFQNENGEFIYDFCQDETGEELYTAVQNAVDAARAEGVDYVYLLAHLGMEAAASPWTYADLIANTNGIDVVFDGHSHDSEQVVMLNKDGDSVVRSACGTKLSAVGYSHISAEEGIVDTNIWSWPNKVSAPELLGIQNSISEIVDTKMEELNEELDEVVASSAVDLTIYDPEVKDEKGNPIRMVRRAETNLGDFCADAFRAMSGADIALENGGGVRQDLSKGDVTYGQIIAVHPFGNEMCVIEANGQQILDALEWGAHSIPDEFAGLLQVSGMTYEVDVNVPSGCKADENNMLLGIEGERRVKNVMVGDAPLDPEKTYSVAGTDYLLLGNGDGHTEFDGCKILQDKVMIDNQVLIEYIAGLPGNEIGGEYADPYGQGRIVIVE